jgi:hypothetical protein
MNKVSVFCYLFLKPYDKIIRYDMLWKNEEKYLLKHTQFAKAEENMPVRMTVSIYESLFQTIASILVSLRNVEIENGVYKTLETSDHLLHEYEQLAIEIEQAIVSGKIRSFSMFGHLCKYRPQTSARSFVKSMGYFMLSTRRPHVYVLDDFIKKEVQNEIHR